MDGTDEDGDIGVDIAGDDDGVETCVDGDDGASEFAGKLTS